MQRLKHLSFRLHACRTPTPQKSIGLPHLSFLGSEAGEGRSFNVALHTSLQVAPDEAQRLALILALSLSSNPRSFDHMSCWGSVSNSGAFTEIILGRGGLLILDASWSSELYEEFDDVHRPSRRSMTQNTFLFGSCS